MMYTYTVNTEFKTTETKKSEIDNKSILSAPLNIRKVSFVFLI